ncbi:MAG TPA: hypothetical protein VG389_26390 [Myxococcota bacterium]|jgi:hypothetical protein|nr:hypothetical protein [Myxococcota bacterium]
MKLASVFVSPAAPERQHWMLYPGFDANPGGEMLIAAAAVQFATLSEFLLAAAREGGPEARYLLGHFVQATAHAPDSI